MPDTTRDTVQVWLANYAAAARPPQQSMPEVDEAAYATMSARERMFYCRQFDQRQFDHTGGRTR
jgi:hypothetical protein